MAKKKAAGADKAPATEGGEQEQAPSSSAPSSSKKASAKELPKRPPTAVEHNRRRARERQERGR